MSTLNHKAKQMYPDDIINKAGFRYIGISNTVRCDNCGLEVSVWIPHINLFAIHKERNPNCSNVCSQMLSEYTTASSPFIVTSSTPAIHNDEQGSTQQDATGVIKSCPIPTLSEAKAMKENRQKTYSTWPHSTPLSSSRMIEAGFFNCNVGDRVICHYCKIVCQQWKPYTNDPWEVHKTFSPACPYVTVILKRQETSSSWIPNKTAEPVSPPSICSAVTQLKTTFALWTNENRPSNDDFVRAGFYYTGIKTIVRCFYCNGSLQNWKARDKPIIEHARWFLNCAYAKQQCGTELHQNIQANGRQIEVENDRYTYSILLERSMNDDDSSPLVNARLDLPMSRNLMKDFVQLIIRRCWEKRLILENNDFVDQIELYIACCIMAIQNELGIDQGRNIIIPSVKMAEHRFHR